MQFSDTLTKTGILQRIEIKAFGDDGYGQITDSDDRKYQFTDRCNRALDRFAFLAMTADGRWQWDDSNYDDLSIATTNLISGQRDYEFALSHLEVEKVLIKTPDGTWKVLDPFDQTDTSAVTYLENNTGNSGTPTRYDKRGVTLFLDVSPNYNSTAGIKVYFKRGPSYFVYSDTGKQPGFASVFHPYVANYAATHYMLDRSMPQAKDAYALLLGEEKAIKEFYSMRNKDEKPGLRVKQQNNK